ncbi:hypothetical protein F2Q69_00032303 [Brassica cretica]|uniref:Uncharacterized protein n=1 Tax=Brassica cretica TaxID=69181 RepID=A0A8S9S287_BRACR|nr:hypothetical protein F2Q69_00032303 [Brassica cretica]
MTHHSPNVSHPVTRRCTSTAVLSSFRRGQVSYLLGVFTKTDVQIWSYLSCAKSLLFTHLPVDSSSSTSSSLAAFSLEKQTTTSLLRSVSLPNIKWKCPSISISVLLSCVAVRLGPEDATGFVSAILRGEDWMLTSLVTISQLSGREGVVKVLSTHLSLVLNSLSSSHEELSYLSAFVIVVYHFNQRGWLIPSVYCNRTS